MKTKKIIKELRQLNPGIGDYNLATEAANRLEMLSVEQKKLHEKLKARKAELNALFKTIREHCGCDLCKYEAMDHDEEPCFFCRGTGGDSDNWEWRGAEDTNVLTKSATDINVGSKEE